MNSLCAALFVKLEKLALDIGKVGMLVATLCFIIMCAIGFGQKGKCAQEVIAYFIVAVTILVVAVPEGLPLAVTLSLAVTSARMNKDNNLVKVLSACETMGSATTICTDKTGTLTTNMMTVKRACTLSSAGCGIDI